MQATIVSVGSELLQGVITDRNAAFLSQELTANGVEVIEVVQSPDDLERLVSTLRRVAAISDLVITTGGIGPTQDDLTREAIATLCDETPNVDLDLASEIEAIFMSRGLTMPESNLKQAWIIPSARSIRNPNGTAPGWYVKTENAVIVALPGPPRENQPMWRDDIALLLLPDLTGDVILSRTLKTIGIGESDVARRLKDVIDREFPRTATYAKSDGVHVRITAAHQDQLIAHQVLESTAAEAMGRIGEYVYGNDSDSLCAAIVKPLVRASHRLAVWEAGAAGKFISLLQGDDSVSQVVPDARATTFTEASTRAGTDDVTSVATYCSRSAAQTNSVEFGASLAIKIIKSEESSIESGEIGMAFHQPDGEYSRYHTISSNPDEIRRRATLWAAEFFWRLVQEATNNRRS